MDTHSLEQMLRKAPQPEPPVDLLARLHADVRVGTGAEKRAGSLRAGSNWLSPWLVRFAFGACVVIGVAVVLAQSVMTTKLNRENEELRQELKAMGGIVGGAEASAGSSEDELLRLREEFAELQRLQAEIDALRGQAQEEEQLRAENAKLRTELAARLGPALALEGSALEEARAKAASIKCVNNMKNIGLALRIYSTDNKDTFPASLLDASKQLSTPKLLHCPSDADRAEAQDWQEFSIQQSSYDYFGANLGEREIQPNLVVAICQVHNHVCLADGSVHQNPTKAGSVIQVRNGHRYLERPTATSFE